MDKNLNLSKHLLASKSIQVIVIITHFILEVFKAMFDLVLCLLEYKAVQLVILFSFVFVVVYQFLLMLSA